MDILINCRGASIKYHLLILCHLFSFSVLANISQEEVSDLISMIASTKNSSVQFQMAKNALDDNINLSVSEVITIVSYLQNDQGYSYSKINYKEKFLRLVISRLLELSVSELISLMNLSEDVETRNFLALESLEHITDISAVNLIVIADNLMKQKRFTRRISVKERLIKDGLNYIQEISSDDLYLLITNTKRGYFQNYIVKNLQTKIGSIDVETFVAIVDWVSGDFEKREIIDLLIKKVDNYQIQNVFDIAPLLSSRDNCFELINCRDKFLMDSFDLFADNISVNQLIHFLKITTTMNARNYIAISSISKVKELTVQDLLQISKLLMVNPALMSNEMVLSDLYLIQAVKLLKNPSTEDLCEIIKVGSKLEVRQEMAEIIEGKFTKIALGSNGKCL